MNRQDAPQVCRHATARVNARGKPRSPDPPSDAFTVDDGARMVETHLRDFDGDLYGTTLAIDLLERLRPDARFDSLEALIAQMQLDKARAREVLASVPVA